MSPTNSGREKLLKLVHCYRKACWSYVSRTGRLPSLSHPREILRGQSSQFLLLTLTMLLIASGCATQLADYQPRPIDQYRHVQVENGLAVVIEPLTETAEAEKYFGTDLVSKGILAVFVIVQNRGETSILVSTEKIALGEGQVGSSPKGPDSADATATGMGVGLIGAALFPPLVVPLVVFLPIASSMIANSNEMKHNFQTKELRTKTLSPGGSTSGFLYFKIPSTVNTPTEQWAVAIELNDLTLMRMSRIVIPFQWQRRP
jgi:hypothetical protein